MTEKATDLSIVIPFYRGEPFISRLIGSLANSLKVSGSELRVEIILIIDSMESETDSVRSVIEPLLRDSLQTIFLVHKNEMNVGVAMSRNIGKKMASGRFITFIDQDDYVDEAYFAALSRNLSEEFDFFLLNGLLTYETNDFKRAIFIYRYRVTFGIIAKSNFLITPGIMVMNRKTVTHDFRQVSSKRAGSDDWAFYLELLSGKRKRYKYIMDQLFYYVVHEHNFHHSKLNFLLSQIRTIQHFQKADPRNLTLRIKVASLKFRLKLNLSMISLKTLNASDVAGFLSLAYIELSSINNIIWLFLLQKSKRKRD
jgi:glycosyltransferase involved in cell wall biosynthesis